jgi:hypothetical protein
VVAAWIWKILLTDAGIINQVLEFFHIPTTQWLQNPSTALLAIVATSVWQGFGFETVIFLAALAAIPADLYDAALVDGASAWQRFRFVTLPAPARRSCSAWSDRRNCSGLRQVFVMSNGAVARLTRTHAVVFDWSSVQRLDRRGVGVAHPAGDPATMLPPASSSGGARASASSSANTRHPVKRTLSSRRSPHRC